MRSHNSLLVESAVAVAEAETRSRPSLARSRQFLRIPVSMATRKKPGKGTAWIPEEDAFVRENVGYLSDEQIGAKLGRSRNAIHQRRERELHLLSPRQDPRWLTANQITNGMGIDGKTVYHLIDRGLLPGRRLPMNMVTRVVDRQELLRWLADPMHWCYFDPRRVGLFHSASISRRLGHPDIIFWRQARQQVLEARRQWKDEWLRSGQAADLLGFNKGKWHSGSGRLNEAIHHGLLKATKWGNWWILKSEVLSFEKERIVHGWGKRKISRIHFIDDWTMDWKAVVRKRNQSPYYVRKFARIRRRDAVICRALAQGVAPKALGKKYKMTAWNISRIWKKRKSKNE